MIARFARLYPVHLLTLLGSAVLVGVLSVDAALPTENESHTAAQLLANLLLLHALPGAVAWNAPAWSVGCEAVAYLVFPLFAASLLRLRPATAIALCVTVSLAQFTLVVHLGRMPSSLPPLSWVRIAGEFALGCLLWAAWRHHPEPRRWWDVVAVLSLTATVVWLGFAPLGPPTFAVVPLLALVVVAAASAAGPVRAMLASRWMVWGGRVSYSLYLTHYLVMVVLGRLVPVRELTDSPLWLRLGVVALHLAAVIGVAATTYHLVEEPLRAWLRQRLASPQTTRVTRSAP